VWDSLAALATGDLGEVVAVADPEPRLRARAAHLDGRIRTHETYDALLERSDLHGVMVFADNRGAAELGIRALDRRLPVMIEKPMAADLEGAEALLAGWRAAGVPLMINWPSAWRPALRHGLALVRSGIVGEPVQISHRGGHAGPREFGCSTPFVDWLYDRHRNGGGALVDYCGYGAILCRTVLGQPAAVTAVAAHLRKEGLAAEDNAVVVLRYSRALGLLEASWTQIGGEPGLAMIVYGDGGTVLVHQPRPVRAGDAAGLGQIQLVTAGRSEWIDPPALPADLRDGPTYFLSRIRDGRPVEGLCAPEVGRDVQEILAAALRSSATGREVRLPLARD
jgi:predicted dehydrogenase